MARRAYKAGDRERIEIALAMLIQARNELVAAGACKTAARARLAISSCKGALRNIDIVEHNSAPHREPINFYPGI